MRRIVAVGLVGMVGCGGAVQAPPETVYVETPVYVPVDSGVTNLDVIRVACPWLYDSDIFAAVAALDNDWYNGYTIGDQYAVNDDFCGYDTACLDCFDTIVEYVYLVYH